MSATVMARAVGRIVLSVFVAALLLPSGMALGAELARVLARWQDRDIGELKGLYVWSSLTAGPVLSLGGIWVALVLTRAGPLPIRVVRALFGGALLAWLVLCIAAYEPIKTSGEPVIAYELRLPPGVELDDRSRIDVTVWSKTGGHGCSIDGVAVLDGHPTVSGTCVVGITNENPTMSLLIRPNSEGHWTLPVPARPVIERSWGPWMPLAFLPPPRQSTVPLPEGAYEIRYRVRGFI